MPKSSRGGKVSASVSIPRIVMPTKPQTQDDDNNTTPQQVTPNLVQPSVKLDNFRNLTDDEKADIIDTLIKTPVPTFLAKNSFQQFTYGMKMDDKPTLVDDKTLDTMSGTDLYRTINNSVDTVNRMKFDADEIATQVLKGTYTRVSDSGGSVYGKGIYFANNYLDSVSYGNSRGNIKKTAVIRGKLNPNAKTISYRQATVLAQKEMTSGSKLGKVLSKADSKSATSIYALAKGYDVMTSGHGYYTVLNRGALTMSKDIKASSSKW